MTVLVSDSFNRANSTTTLGTTDSYNGGTAKSWQTVNAAIFGINSNQAYQVSGTNGIAFIDAGVSDCSVSFINTTGLTYSNPIVRIVDVNNHISIQNDGTKLFVYKRVSGTYTSLGSVAYVQSVNDLIKVRMQGTTIEVFVNGVSKITVTATEYATSTKHGFSPADTTRRFDNFQIEDLSTGGTGTDGSTLFDLKQSLYSDSFMAEDTKQTLYADSSVQTDTKQTIYSDSATGYDTKLSIYQDSFFNADTFQEIIDGINGSTLFDVKLSFYADNAMNMQTMIHQYYQDGFKEVDLLQIISETIITKMSWRNETKETVSLWGSTSQPTTTWKDPDLTTVPFRGVK
jgi:hypothetical protein